MKKKILILVITIIYLILISCCNYDSNNVRLRIIANSNNEYDQKVKNDIKDYLKIYLKDYDILNIDLKKLEEKLNNEFEPKIKVERRYVNYEAKSYNNKLVQAGTYDTILITIGEGKGKNFWTLLYPDYFNISFEEDNEVEYRSYLYDIIFNSYK